MQGDKNSNSPSLMDALIHFLAFLIGISCTAALLLTRRCVGIDNYRQFYFEPVTRPYPNIWQRWSFPVWLFIFFWSFSKMMQTDVLERLFISLGYFVTCRAYLELIFWEFSNKSEASVPTTSLGFNCILPYIMQKENDPNLFVRYSNLIEPVFYGLLSILLWRLKVPIVALFFGTICIGLSIKIITSREKANIENVIVRNKWLFDKVFQTRMNNDHKTESNSPKHDAPVS